LHEGGVASVMAALAYASPAVDDARSFAKLWSRGVSVVERAAVHTPVHAMTERPLVSLIPDVTTNRVVVVSRRKSEGSPARTFAAGSQTSCAIGVLKPAGSGHVEVGSRHGRDVDWSGEWDSHARPEVEPVLQVEQREVVADRAVGRHRKPHRQVDPNPVSCDESATVNEFWA